MIAYNSNKLDNRYIQEQAEDAQEKKCITEEELNAIKTAFPEDLYTPNFYIRIGLFILATIILFFSFGLFCLFIMNAGQHVIGTLCLFFGLGTYVALEVVVREKKHYKSGLDAALMWWTGVALLSGIGILTRLELSPWIWCAAVLALSLYFVVRFADVGMSIIAYLALIALVFNNMDHYSQAAKIAAPFVLMLLSLGIYIASVRFSAIHAYRHYKRCAEIIQICSLLTLYVGGNYYVVREASVAMFDQGLSAGIHIPGAWIFWTLTVALPLVYIYAGIRRKNRILIGVGLLLIAAMVYTIRTYHSVAPIEVAMTLGGICMIGIAYGLTKYLKTPRNGFTAESTGERHAMEAMQIESLVIAQTLSHGPQPEGNQFDFGGGSGGGGGATGDF